MNKKKAYFLAKRVMDIILSFCSILLFSPMMIFASVLVLLDGTWGPLFAEAGWRAGKGGRKFFMLKFRSMVPGAHLSVESDPVLIRRRQANGGKIKAAQDPRITFSGRIIRFFDIDELPQFFNVIKGDMSIVGPRPYFEKELDDYASGVNCFDRPCKDLILSVKPGITGLWQVTGRNKIPLQERVRVDADYARNCSFTQDLAILLKTPFVVLLRIGAW